LRPPAVSSRFAYTVGVVLPLGPAYLAAALLEAGHRVAVVDALGEAPLRRGPTAHPKLTYHGLSIPEIVERIDRSTDAIAISVMFSQQWPHVDALIRRPGRVPVSARRPAPTLRAVARIQLPGASNARRDAPEFELWLQAD